MHHLANSTPPEVVVDITPKAPEASHGNPGGLQDFNDMYLGIGAVTFADAIAQGPLAGSQGQALPEISSPFIVDSPEGNPASDVLGRAGFTLSPDSRKQP